MIAELYKARSTRSVWWLGAVAVVFCVVWAVVDVALWLGDRSDRDVEAAYAMAQQGYLFALVIGVLLVAGEYRHRTVTWALLVTPHRSRVVVAKLAACAVVGLVVGLAGAAATGTYVFAATGLFTAGVPLALLGSVVSTALWTVLGGALGALVRNQTATVVGAFLWFFYAEWLLIALVPAVGRWTPSGAAKAVSGWTRDAMPVAGDLLPMWAGGLLFLAYALAAAGLAVLTTTRRDVT
ncbi:ABC transporter permease [Actinophytocola sp.]|uniref:ABC transporter permease n=1 Tax=Actinophytocola sp. TaxID=1872138 RepID=UPI00389A87DE